MVWGEEAQSLEQEAQSLGPWLREQRRAQHVSQEDAASKAGVARSTLNRWERGTHQPRLPELLAVLDVLKASPVLREQALSLLDAPRALRQLRDERESGSASEQCAPSQEAWVFTPQTGDLLRALRLRAKQTQEQVAAKLGVRRNTLSGWEGSDLVPSGEHLDQLMILLAAHPAERAALSRGQLLPLRLDEGDTSLEALAARIGQIAEGSYDARMEPLKDLEYLRLERALAQLTPRSLDARYQLANTYSWHAQWLAGKQRYREAAKYADRVIEAIHYEAMPEAQWQRAVLAAAKCAVYSGALPRPERGVEVLEQWLPLIDRPEFEGWVLSDMAFYLSHSGQVEAALTLATRACRVAQRCDNPSELRCRRVDRAEMLLQTGQPHEVQLALDLLPIDQAFYPVERVREALLWATGLLLVGEKAEAQGWLERAQVLVAEHHLEATTLNSLTQRF